MLRGLRAGAADFCSKETHRESCSGHSRGGPKASSCPAGDHGAHPGSHQRRSADNHRTPTDELTARNASAAGIALESAAKRSPAAWASAYTHGRLVYHEHLNKLNVDSRASAVAAGIERGCCSQSQSQVPGALRAGHQWAGSPVGGHRHSQARRASRRARGAPRQTWMPLPKARCLLGVRRMSKVSGSGKVCSSRLAAPSQRKMG